MALNAQEKEALAFHVTELIAADEPEAVVAVLLRISQRLTQRAIRQENWGAAERWVRLVTMLEKVSQF